MTQPQLIRKLEKSAKVGDHDKACVISFNDNNDDPSSIRMTLTDAASMLNLLEYVFFSNMFFFQNIFENFSNFFKK